MLKIEHLKKTFSGKTILDDISLEVKSGEIVSIIGPSGTGKTTLLRCVNFLEKPDRGTITIDEVTADAEHSDGKTIHRLVQKSGMVFQSYNLFHNKTVLENVMEAQIIVKKRSRKGSRRDRPGKAERGRHAGMERQLSLPDFRRTAATDGHRQSRCHAAFHLASG